MQFRSRDPLTGIGLSESLIINVRKTPRARGLRERSAQSFLHSLLELSFGLNFFFLPNIDPLALRFSARAASVSVGRCLREEVRL